MIRSLLNLMFRMPKGPRWVLMRLVRAAIWPGDRLMAAKALSQRSWYIEKNRGIANMQGVPLMAWMNYHHREIHAKKSYWMGHQAVKNPMDAWIYQEILFEVKPDIIIEIGNRFGGGTYFLATMCDLIGHGKVIGVDLDHDQFEAPHPRIELVTGDSSSKEVLDTVRAKCEGQKVLIIHDADHTRDGVLRDLRNYGDLVSPGSYLIVEDTIIGVPGFIGGVTDVNIGPFLLPRMDTPLQAVEQFTSENHDFEVDESRERYILTENYRGFLRRLP